jgi:hypothetical protein
MRIINSICSFALLAAACASVASAATIDTNSDFDCATAYQYAYRMAVAKNLEADVQEQTSLMNARFAEEWGREHPSDNRELLDHYSAVLDALVDDPKGAIDTLKSCSTRANADPSFEPFVILRRKPAPAAR